jgi:hypothetical protein
MTPEIRCGTGAKVARSCRQQISVVISMLVVLVIMLMTAGGDAVTAARSGGVAGAVGVAQVMRLVFDDGGDDNMHYNFAESVSAASTHHAPRLFVTG